MANKRAAEQATQTRRWEQRLESRDFKKTLTAAVERELRHVANLTLREIINPKLGHTLIDEWGFAAIEQKQLGELILAAGIAVNEVLRDCKDSPQELLGAQTVKQIEALVFDSEALTGNVETFVADLMEQDFIRQLFTEIVFTSIVSFNKKVNPLFASFTMRAMEDQIKGFIRLFMPMIQKQAAAFAIDNHAAVLDLTRKLVAEAMQRPINTYVGAPSATTKSAGGALLQRVLHSADLEALSRTAAHAAWDGIYAKAGKLTLGELLHLDRRAAHLAASTAELILPLLAHPPLLELMANEIEAARADVAPTVKKSRQSRKRPDPE